MSSLKAFVISLLLLFSYSAIAQDRCAVVDSVARARAVEYYYLQARSYIEQDSLDCCFELLEHCRALDSASLTVMYDLSSFYAFLNRDSIAHDMLIRIVEADPSNIYYSKALVNYYLKVGDNDAAIKVYEKMLDSTTSKNDICMYLFTLYSETGRYDKAIEMLDMIEKLEGSNDEILINKIRLYLALGDSTKAVDVVYDMIKESPDDIRCQTILGNTYTILGDRAKALEAYNKVLAVKPDDIYVLTSLAEFYVNENDDSLYCDIIERLLKNEGFDSQSRINTLVKYIEYTYPKDSVRVTDFMREMYSLPFDELEIANVYSRYLAFIKSSPDTIVPVLEKILSLEPDNFTVIVQLLEYAIESNDIEAVFKYADNAWLYSPDRLEICYYKGLASYLLGRKEESLEIYKEGLEKRADDTSPELVSTVYALLGDTYHELDLMDSCMQAYDSALVYDSNNIGVLNNYAYFLALAGKDLNRALEMSQKTVLAEPENITCIDTYAWVLFKLGRYEEAKAYADKLISIGDEFSSEVYSHCGDIYAKCGDIEQAVSFWIKARDAGDDSKILSKKIKKRKYYNDAKRK